MYKKTGLSGLKFSELKLLKNNKSLSLVELLISIMSVGIMVLSFYSLETFSHTQVMSADRRAKVQNSLAYCLEYMSKYVQQATGTLANPGIKLYGATGFQVRVDFNSPQTPNNLSDDAWIYFSLSGNTLQTCCTGPGTCGTYPVVAENLTSSTTAKKIIAGFVNDIIPSNNPTNGFYVKGTDTAGNFSNYVDIGLAGLYDTSIAYSWLTRATNPKVALKTKVICSNISTN
jgi:hypothetical protein